MNVTPDHRTDPIPAQREFLPLRKDSMDASFLEEISCSVRRQGRKRQLTTSRFYGIINRDHRTAPPNATFALETRIKNRGPVGSGENSLNIHVPHCKLPPQLDRSGARFHYEGSPSSK